ncbi:MAG: pectin acetylesterase-family hydrolase, partial [Gammaproteobacteria bacterium]
SDPLEVKDFTRVFLNDNPLVRCLDGTRPVIYVDTAICTDGVNCTYGEQVRSDKWIISMRGGGSCNARDTNGHGVFDDIQQCLDTYATDENKEMGTALDPPMKNLDGINLPNPQKNPVFAKYNRVRVEKCSYDRYNGRVAYEAAGGYFQGTDPHGAAISANLYQQGYLIMEEALRTLRNGLDYPTWTASPGATEVTEITGHLPPLREAEQVLFVGHSGAAHGLRHNIDYLAEALKNLPGFTGDVRAVFDASFVESIENEAAFPDPLQSNNDAYSNVWSGDTSGSGTPFAYDGATYYTTSPFAEQHHSWQTRFDASCMDAHAAGDQWKCRDVAHVTFNHLATPFFFREDFADPNPEHTADGSGHRVTWADPADWDTSSPGCSETSPCPPVFSFPEEHRARLEQQFKTLLEGSSLRSELATGLDTSLNGAGLFPSWYAWMPTCKTHEGTYKNNSFFDTTINYLTDTQSLREWLESFVSAPPFDHRELRVDGWDDGAGNIMEDNCPDIEAEGSDIPPQ